MFLESFLIAFRSYQAWWPWKVNNFDAAVNMIITRGAGHCSKVKVKYCLVRDYPFHGTSKSTSETHIEHCETRIMYSDTDHVFRHGSCIQTRIMYSDTDHVFRHGSCIQTRIMYSDTDHVFRHGSCIQTRIMYSDTDHVFRHGSCIQTRIMYSDTDHVFRHGSCIQTRIMYSDTDHVFRDDFLSVI